MKNFKENVLQNFGIVIIGISIITRVFIVSISWNYGIFITAIKNRYPESVFVELGWIAGLGQGLGSILSPIYVLLYKKIGVKLTFFIAILLCFVSLITSSFVPNEHYLFLTYSLPFGIGSSLTFVMGSLVTGSYYPPEHKYHVTATVLISLGFPIGFLILNPLNEFLFEYYNNDWQTVQRIYALITFFLMIICCPFFTDKYSELKQKPCKHLLHHEIELADEFITLKSEHFVILIKIFWLLGLFFNSIANNSILINLDGYFRKIHMSPNSMSMDFIFLGLSDCGFRILLSIIGQSLKNNLSAMYLVASFIGFVLSNLWSEHTIPMFNTIYCILYGICPAVLMSLMYPINSEISGSNNIEYNYTINVMISGFGIVLGPIITGFLLDNSNKSYETVFKSALRFYFLSIVLYAIMKFLIIKYTVRVLKNNNDIDSKVGSDYIEFENDANY